MAVTDQESQSVRYDILDGKKRYYTFTDSDAIPAVVVSGFPDDQTRKMAAVSINRVGTLNLLDAATTIGELRNAGLNDSEIRRKLGLRTGEVKKIVSVFNTLSTDIRKLLFEGAIAESTALEVAKLPTDVQAKLMALYNEKKKTQGLDAAITGADVEAVKSERSAATVESSESLLTGLADSVTPGEATGKVDSQKGDSVASKITESPKKKK